MSTTVENMSVAIPRGTPLPSESAFRSLRQWLVEKKWNAGDRLPPEESLAKDLQIARGTLRRALKQLETEGLLVAARGRGRVVAGSAGRGSELMSRVVAIISGLPSTMKVGREEELEKAIEMGVAEALDEAEMHRLTLHPSGLKEEVLRRFLSDHPLGVVVTGHVGGCDERRTLLAALAEHSIPVVVNSDGPELAAYDRVISDHEAGSYELTRWLIAQGRRRILRAWGVAKETYFIQMHDTGYERAMREAGLEALPPLDVPPLLVATERDEARATFEQRSRVFAGYLLQHLTGPRPVDAIMVSTDSTTFPVAAACRLCGRMPHRDVTIVGYDGYWANWPDREWEPTVPSATVVKHNQRTGAELVRVLLERINGKAPDEPQRVVLAPEMVVIEEAAAG